MKAGLLKCSVAAGVVGFAASANAVVINEMRGNVPGSDSAGEYVELFGTPGESLDGLTFVGIGDFGTNVGTIENVVDLSGQSIPADGYFVIADVGFGGGDLGFDPTVLDLAGLDQALENNDSIAYLLVTGFSGMLDDDLDTDDDGTLDTLAWASIVDGIQIIDPTPDRSFDYSAQLGIPSLGPDGNFSPAQWYRNPDGSGDFEIGAFNGGTDTPGATNVPEPATAVLLGLGGLAMLRRRG
ncbi:MAG: PEP-CTERM sorting domain-containing protein [Planctomycetota bacterium]